MSKSATFDDFPGLQPGDENYRARMLLELCSAEIRNAVGVRVTDGGDIAALDVHPEMRALAILTLEAIVGTKNLTQREQEVLFSINSLGGPNFLLP
jgi:hypothetical protein